MSKVKKRLLLGGLLLCAAVGGFFLFWVNRYADYTELGIPQTESYPNNVKARCVWDMAVFGDRLFIGTGDYDANAGPVEIWSLSFENREWTKSGVVPDEEINRFCVIDGALTVPGIDPRDDWTLGNYYVWEENAWMVRRTIPEGIHNFDLVEFGGMLFAGLGVERGGLPVSFSSDGGETFSSVSMIKNGLPLDTSGSQVIRVYDLFVLGDTLYALFYGRGDEVAFDLYRYDDGAFVFDNTWLGKVHQIQYMNNLIGGKAEFGGKMFFATGYLYSTEDMTEIQRIAFPKGETVYDLFAADGCLYVLCGQLLEDGQYRVSVWRNKSGENDDFKKAFTFLYDAPPLSMVRYGDSFYIGMGDFSSENEKNGMVIEVEWD